MTADLRDSLSLHANALMLHERRSAILATNIANAATPGFKARDMDFNAELARLTGQGEMAAPAVGHFTSGRTMAGELGYREAATPAFDGNTVDSAVEQVQFAENTLRQQASLTLLGRRISGLMAAIRGE